MAPREGRATAATRRVAVLATDGVDAVSLRPLLQLLADGGAVCTLLGPHLGSITTSGGRRMEVGGHLAATSSVLFDAVLVASGKDSVQALLQSGHARHFVLEAYKHAKPLCLLGDGAELLAPLGIAAGAKPETLVNHPGVVLAATQTEGLPQVAQDFLQAIALHRHWDRPQAETIAA